MAKVERKLPEIWYSGSLVQQNHGETISDHGFLIWDNGEASPKQVDIDNDYGFYTLDVEDSKLPIDEDVPKKARLRLRSRKTSSNEIRRISDDARALYSPVRLSVISEDDDFFEETSAEFELGKLGAEAYQAQLIEEYCTDKFGVKASQLDRIRNLHSEICKEVDGTEARHGSRWRIRRFEFSNLFNYGENNVVDFHKMDGVLGIFAKNASGKSNLLDAVLFTLFDESTRAGKTKDVLRNGADRFSARIEIEIDGELYEIHRRGKLQGNGKIPVKVDFHKIEDDGTKKSLNGKYRYYTNLNIEKYIGSYEDFVHTALSAQNQNTPFINKSQSQRKDLLARFVGLDAFDSLYSKAKSKAGKVQALANDLSDASVVEEELHDLRSEKKEKEKKARKLQDPISENKHRKSDLLDQLLEAQQKIKSVPNVKPENVLKSKFKDARAEQESAKKKLGKLEDELQALNSKSVDVPDVEALKKEAKANEALKSEIEKLERRVKSKVREKESLVEELGRLEDMEFDPDCEFCVKRNEEDSKRISTIKDKIEALQGQVPSLENRVAEKREEYDDRAKARYESAAAKEKEKMRLENRISKFENKKQRQKSKLEKAAAKVEDVKAEIKKSREYEEQRQRNSEAKAESKALRQEANETENKIETLKNQRSSLKSRVEVLKEKMNAKSETLQKIERLSNLDQAYKWYIDAVKRNGVPYRVIKSFVPKLEERINSVLSQVAEFAVKLDFDDRNINAAIVGDTDGVRPIGSGSGMERFLCSIAIRTSLASLSTVPKPRMLMIDEGFGNLDSDNLASIPQVFDYLKSAFDFVLVVSHVREMRGGVDSEINIRPGDPAFVSFT